MMTMIRFRDWILSVDFQLTKQMYDSGVIGGSESCICEDCKNFVDNFDNVYPPEVMNLFRQLGIDYRKDAETWRMCKENNLHLYSGLFHFKGKFEGENCEVLVDKNTTTFNLIPITENFEIGFRYDDQLTLFSDKNNLVQIEFLAKIPWTIDKSLEGE